MRERISVFIPGTPVPQGSVSAFGNRVVHQKSRQLKAWRRLVEKGVCEPGVRFTGAVEVSYRFLMPRPKSHFRTGRYAHLLRDAAPRGMHSQKPDLDKLVRAANDALTDSLVIEDDARIGRYPAAEKLWADHGESPGLFLTIEGLRA